MQSVLERPVRDKEGLDYTLACCPPENADALTCMYEKFTPKKTHQGLPPATPHELAGWIDCLMRWGRNFTILKDQDVVGHCSLLPDMKRMDAEFIIFVLEPFRSRGLGSALTAAALEEARNLGLKTVWLTVESINFRAIRLYKKYGFQFADESGWERIMSLGLDE